MNIKGENKNKRQDKGQNLSVALEMIRRRFGRDSISYGIPATDLSRKKQDPGQIPVNIRRSH